MNCPEFRDKTHEHLRGNLPRGEEVELKAHAEECSECSDFTSTCSELTCKEFVDFLHSFIDGELAKERATVFDRHLSVCPDCTAYLESYRRTMELSVLAMTDLSVSEKIPEELVLAVLNAQKQGE